MKHIILSLFIFSFSIGVWAQCPTGDITLSSQQAIDNFATNYPGCTEILNDITIGENIGITSLSGLSPLTSINGRLRVASTGITNLAGLGHFSQSK